LRLLVVVELLFDAVHGAVEHIDGRPEEIGEIEVEAGVGDRGDQGVEDVGDGAFDDAVFRWRALVQLVFGGAIAVELQVLDQMVGRG
jgi:hypothetical protein